MEKIFYLTILFLLAPTITLAHTGDDTFPYHMGMMGNNWGIGWGWGWGWFFMILFWIFVFLAVLALIKWLTNQSTGKSRDESTLEILKKRYTRGEIDKKEFETEKKDLI